MDYICIGDIISEEEVIFPNVRFELHRSGEQIFTWTGFFFLPHGTPFNYRNFTIKEKDGQLWDATGQDVDSDLFGQTMTNVGFTCSPIQAES